MSEHAKICCKCKSPIVGFVAYKDVSGDWCEDCANYVTCEDCGAMGSGVLDGGLCDYCEAKKGEID